MDKKRIAIICVEKNSTTQFREWVLRHIDERSIVAVWHDKIETRLGEYVLVRSIKDCYSEKFDGLFSLTDDNASRRLEAYIRARSEIVEGK